MSHPDSSCLTLLATFSLTLSGIESILKMKKTRNLADNNLFGGLMVKEPLYTNMLQRGITVYHITYGPEVPKHSAINHDNALVQYRFLPPRFSIITLLQTWQNRRHL